MKFTRSRLAVLIVTIFILLSTGCNQQQTLNPIQSDIEEKIEAILSEHSFRGLVLISQEDNSHIVGKENYTDKTLLHPIGSVTKVFTSVAIMKLQEEGSLNLDDQLSMYIPEIKHGEIITIRHLLAHRSGLPHVLTLFELGHEDVMSRGFLKKWDEKYSDMTRAEFNEVLVSADFELYFNPGSEFDYSNMGYDLLGIVIERVSGKSYIEYLDEVIFNPLGIENIRLWKDHDKDQFIKTLYFDEKEWQSIGKFSSLIASSGGLFATAEDLLKFAKGLQSNQILQKTSLDEMTARGDGDFGLGMILDEDNNYFHTGGIFGFSTMLKFYKESQDIVIYFTDNVARSTFNDVGDQIFKVIIQGNND